MKLKIGITMRITESSDYYELRNSIAVDWIDFLNLHFSEYDLILLPNSNFNIIDYLKSLGINCFFLVGGEDIGSHEIRDNTELKICKYAHENNLPVIGICRGLQILTHYFGGEIVKGDIQFSREHLATRHKIRLKNKIEEVNSYHSNTIKNLPKNFNIIAKDINDDSIEAASYENFLGLMWHPERENNIPEWQILLIKNFIKKYERN